MRDKCACLLVAAIVIVTVKNWYNHQEQLML